MQETECIVNGALGWALRLSQITGMSPMTIISHNEGLTIRYSLRRDVGGKLFYGIYALFNIVFCTWNVTTHIKLEAESMLIKTASFMSIGFTAIVVTVVVFEGAGYMKGLIDVINTIQKFHHVSIEKQKIRKKEKSKTCTLMLYFCFIVILHCFNWSLISSDALKDDSYYIITTLLFTIGYTAMVIEEIRFVFIALTIISALKAINDSLSQLLLDIKHNAIGRNMSSAHKKVRQLANLYSYLCESLKSLNEGIGGALFLTANFFLMSFVFSTYSVVMCYRFEIFKTIINGACCNFENKGFVIALEIVWCVVYLINLLVLVEPCHRTTTEMEVIQSYINQIIYCLPKVDISGPLENELEMFYRLVVTDKPAYSPFQLYTLNRTILLKMISWAVSYLVIVLQFKAKS